MTSEEQLQAEADEQSRKTREKDMRLAQLANERLELAKKLHKAGQ